MQCLDANVVQGLMAGALDTAARLDVLGHLDACVDCRELIAISAHDHEPIAARVGRYVLHAQLGAGAMGVVWLADDPELGRKVALKVLQRPMREARSLAQINDPNVVAVYDVGIADGAMYIAMELVEGESLRAWQRGRSKSEILEAYIAAGRGLAAAHRVGLVHRDFKPDNVLVGDDGRVRVGDFGLAAASGEVDAGAAGTPAYMAPEQLAGGNVDSRSDQFGFAVSLHEALYGERPAAGALPPRNRVLARALSVQPGDRYPTMEHLLADLGRDRARPWRIAAIAAAAIAAVLVCGIAADAIVRARGERAIDQAFAATGRQIERAGALQAARFAAASALVDQLPPMIALTAWHDQADFGLRPAAEDAQQLGELHELLRSASWQLVRELGPGEVVIADRKGRVMYASAAPDDWLGALDVPAIGDVLAGRAREVVAAVHRDGELAIAFVHAIERNGELGGVFVQVVAARDVLAGIRLDDDTELELVTLDAAAPRDGAVVEVERDGATYQLQARPLLAADGDPIARVVMAREITSVASLFAHARPALAISALVALVFAFAAATGGSRRAVTLAVTKSRSCEF